MARRGRKPKLGAKRRDPIARRTPDQIGPTPERAAKRDHFDFPVDRLLSTEAITEDQHRAAMAYLDLRVKLYGLPHANSAAIYQRVAGELTSPSTAPDSPQAIKYAARIENLYTSARAALLSKSRRLADIVDNAVVYLRRPADNHIPALATGLDILADEMGIKIRRAA